MKKTAAKQRRGLQRFSLRNKKPKEPVIKKPKNKTLILCPIKNVKVYQYVCVENCDYYKRKKCTKMNFKKIFEIIDEG